MRTRRQERKSAVVGKDELNLATFDLQMKSPTF
jgi:hypothetical protein